VQAGVWETRYIRTGSGPQLLLLADSREAEWARALVAALAARFRVFVPELPVSAVSAMEGPELDIAAAWLRGVIDGLGLDRPDLVVQEQLAPLIARFTATETGRVGRVTLIAAVSDEAALRSLVAALDPDG